MCRVTNQRLDCEFQLKLLRAACVCAGKIWGRISLECIVKMNDYVYPLLDTTATTTTTSADFPFLPPAVARFTYTDTDILTSSQRVSVRVIRCRRVAAAAKMPNLSTAYLLRAKF